MMLNKFAMMFNLLYIKFFLLLLQHLLTEYHQEYIPTSNANCMMPVRYCDATMYFGNVLVDYLFSSTPCSSL